MRTDSVETRRLFLALAVPRAVRTDLDHALAPVRARHPELRWSLPATWHMTLAFIGDTGIPPSRIADAVATEIGGCGGLELSLGEAGHFGRTVLWLAVAGRPQGRIEEVAAGVRAGVAGAGAPADTSSLHPHLTLARTRGRGRRQERFVRSLPADVPAVAAQWSSDEVVLYRSHLPRGGPGSGSGTLRHEVEARIALT